MRCLSKRTLYRTLNFYMQSPSFYLYLKRVDNCPLCRNAKLLHCQWLDYVKTNSLEGVPIEKMTTEICLEAVKNNSNDLKHVPLFLINERICYESVAKNYSNMSDVPDHLNSEGLCLESIRLSRGNSLQYISSIFKTYTICLTAVSNYSRSYAFLYVPLVHKTPELCLIAVQRNVVMFEHVPDDKKTKEMCLAVVKMCGVMLYMVPEKLRSLEICKAAIHNDYHYKGDMHSNIHVYGHSLKDVPEEIKNVAKSFMKSGKKKGKKALRDFAKTKHKSLPQKIKENFNHILSFDDFKYSV